MRTSADIIDLIARDHGICEMLEVVAGLQLPDAWIGAGLIRNAVWDHLHDRQRSVCTDVDVIHFDPTCPSREWDAEVEAALVERMPGVAWSVRNQARMHLRNDHPPYASSLHAVSHWVETATAVAARTGRQGVELGAPLGTGDLVDLILRPVPAHQPGSAVFHDRYARKGWLQRWPRLRVVV